MNIKKQGAIGLILTSIGGLCPLQAMDPMDLESINKRKRDESSSNSSEINTEAPPQKKYKVYIAEGWEEGDEPARTIIEDISDFESTPEILYCTQENTLILPNPYYRQENVAISNPPYSSSLYSNSYPPFIASPHNQCWDTTYSQQTPIQPHNIFSSYLQPTSLLAEALSHYQPNIYSHSYYPSIETTPSQNSKILPEKIGNQSITWSELLKHFGDFSNLQPSDKPLFNGCPITLQNLKEDQAFNNFVLDVLTSADYSQINKDSNGTLILRANYIEKIVSKSKAFFSNHPSFKNSLDEKKISDFIISLISLRTLIEIRKNNITCCDAIMYYKDKKNLNHCFKILCDEPGKYNQHKKTEYFQGRGKTSSNSKLCSGFYMNKYRLNVSNEQQNKKPCPTDFFNSFKLIDEIRSSIRYQYLKKEKKDTSLKDIANRVMRGGAYQFEPGYIKDLLCFLKEKYKITATKILDLCSGWGDRLLGSLASRKPFGVDRYIGTDPNEELQDGYKNICQNYAPDGLPYIDQYATNYLDVDYKITPNEKTGYHVTIYKKPLEDLTPEEIHPKGIKSHLMVTSIPYFDRELYNGSNQSHIRYNKYNLWKDVFLTSLVKQSVEGLEVGGIIAVNSAEILNTQKSSGESHNIPLDVDTVLENFGNTEDAKYRGLYLKKLTTFWYDGQKPSPITLYQLCKNEIMTQTCFPNSLN